MNRWLRRVVAGVVVAGVLGVCGCQPGSAEEATLPKSEAELGAIEADQRIRDAQLAVRAIRPENRGLRPLLDLLGTEDLRAGAIEHYRDSWATRYEVDGQLDVVRQQTRLIAEDEVVVTTCERDWINEIDVNGEPTVFRGGRAAARSVSRTFQRSDDGSWVN